MELENLMEKVFELEDRTLSVLKNSFVLGIPESRGVLEHCLKLFHSFGHIWSGGFVPRHLREDTIQSGEKSKGRNQNMGRITSSQNHHMHSPRTCMLFFVYNKLSL